MQMQVKLGNKVEQKVDPVDDWCLQAGRYVEEIRQDAVSLDAKVGQAQGFEQYLVVRLYLAIENICGCGILARHRLVSPLLSIERALLDGFISIYWATSGPERGQRLLDASTEEMVRLARNAIKAGDARIEHRETGQNFSGSFTRDARVSGAKKYPRVDEMARESGLGRLYNMTYGFLSMFAHGGGPLIVAEAERDELLMTHLPAAMSFLRAMHLVVVNHIKNGRPTDIAELEAVLKIRLRQT